MGLFEHFPYTNFHRLNFDWLVGKVKNLLDRMDQAEEDIDDLQTRMSAAEDDIDALETRMQTAEDDIDALETRMHDAEETLLDHNGRIVELEADNIRIWNTILPSRAYPFDDELSDITVGGVVGRTGEVLTLNAYVDIQNTTVAHKIYFRDECVIPFGEADAWAGYAVVSFRDATSGTVTVCPIVRDAINQKQYFTIPSGNHAGSLFGSLIVQWQVQPD